jgi:predicted transcriptional regulator of viral defense system
MSSRIKPIEALLQSGATVWTIHDLRVLWKEAHAGALRDKVKYYVDCQRLLRLRKGLYALRKEYDPFELAQKLIQPSYISLESALREHGVLKQYSSTITCIAPYPREVIIDRRLYRYHRIKADLLSLPLGIEHRSHYDIASPERALCDAFYLGFQPDIGGHHQWNCRLLRDLRREFSVPRVSDGLSFLLPS